MWPQLITAGLGIWLMLAPAVVDYGALSASHARILGPIIAAIGWVSVSEVTRGLRWLNLPCGISLLILATRPGYPPPALINSVVLGLTVSVLVFAGGSRRSSMGGGWAALRRSGADGAIGVVSNEHLKGGEKR